MTVARSGLVNVVLDDSGVDHGERTDPETGYDTVDRGEGDFLLAEEGHEDLVDEGEENDDGDGIKVLHQIVGNAVASHLSSLCDEVVGEITVYDPVDWVEGKDLASDKGTLDFIDEVVVPSRVRGLADGSLVGRLCGVHLAVLDHREDDAECIGDDRALWRTNDVHFAAENKNQCTDEEDAKTQQVCGPEVAVTLHVWSGEQGKRSDIDTPVEDHVNPLDGNGRVDNNPFTSLVVVTNNHLSSLVLIGNEGCNVGFDTTSSETNDNYGSDVATKTSAMVKCYGERSQCQDKQADNVDLNSLSVLITNMLFQTRLTPQKMTMVLYFPRY